MKTFAVVVTDDARLDIDEAELWLLANRGEQSAARVMEIIADGLERLSSSAMTGVPRPEYGENMRLMIAAPYVLYYDVRDDHVVVLRILHQARDRDAIMRHGVQEGAEAFAP
jgi:toxin ParE1/3/4